MLTITIVFFSSGFICQIPWIPDRVQILAIGGTQAIGEGRERREAKGSFRSPPRTHILRRRVTMGAHRNGASQAGALEGCSFSDRR